VQPKNDEITKGDQINLARQVEYWQTVETPYVSFYAFEEVPAAFNDEPAGHGGVLAAHEGIAARISGGAVTQMERQNEADKERVVNAYAFPFDAAAIPQEPIQPQIADSSAGTLGVASFSAPPQHLHEISPASPMTDPAQATAPTHRGTQPAGPPPDSPRTLRRWLGFATLCIMALAVGLSLVYSLYSHEWKQKVRLDQQLKEANERIRQLETPKK
jgi:hypothetical protein